MDKECPSQALARVCEDGLYEFADVLLKHGAKVMFCQWATMPLAVQSRLVMCACVHVCMSAVHVCVHE